MKNILFVLIAGIIILSGCEEVMDVEFSGTTDKKVVVEGGITTDTTSHQIALSWSDDYFSRNKQQMLSGAKVSVSDGTNVFQYKEISDGIYQTDSTVFGEIGKSYTLEVILEDGRVYGATETIKDIPEIDSITSSLNYYHFIPPMDRFGYGYDILYYGYEPEGRGDYYLWKLYINNTLYTDTITETVFTDDEFVDGKYINKFDVYYIPQEDLKMGSNKIELEMFSISKEYYDYIVGLMLETVWRGSPWDGPPANLKTNISNGGMGYFHALAAKRDKIVIQHTKNIEN